MGRGLPPRGRVLLFPSRSAGTPRDESRTARHGGATPCCVVVEKRKARGRGARCAKRRDTTLFRAVIWAPPHPCLPAYTFIYGPNHLLIGLFHTPNWATRRVGSDCARCLTTMQSRRTAAWVGRTSEAPSASHRRRVGCPPIRPDFPLLDSRASASESVLPSSATSSPLRGSLPPPGHDYGVGYPRSPKSEVQASPYLGQKAPGRRC